MGVDVVLVRETGDFKGEIVFDRGNVIARIISDMTDSSYCCLRFIDLYGDTVFNVLQASTLLSEWEKIRPMFIDQRALDLWGDVRKIIKCCKESTHLYIKFIGD